MGLLNPWNLGLLSSIETSFMSSTEDVDLLRTRIFFVEAVGTVASEAGVLAIVYGSRAKEKEFSMRSGALLTCLPCREVQENRNEDQLYITTTSREPR